MLGHSAISELPISTSVRVVVEVVIGGKPLVWLLTKKTNKWEVKTLQNQWNITKTNKWYKNN